MASIVLVDDDASATDGLALVLQREGHEVVGVNSLDRLVRLLSDPEFRVDVAVVDLLLGEQSSGLQAMDALALRRPCPRFIVFTSGEGMGSRRQLLCSAHLRHGLAGAVLKRSPLRVAAEAVSLALQGRTYFDPELTMFLPPERSVEVLLTSRTQASIWISLALGYATHNDIAAAACIARKTYGNQAERMRLQLLDHGLIDETDLVVTERSSRTRDTLTARLLRFASSHREFLFDWARRNPDGFELSAGARSELRRYCG